MAKEKTALNEIDETIATLERAKKLYMKNNLEAIPDLLNSAGGYLNNARIRIAAEIQLKPVVKIK